MKSLSFLSTITLVTLFMMPSLHAQNLLWTKNIGGTDYDEAYAVASDASENVYIAGLFADTADFDPGSAVFNLVSDSAQSNIFVSKLDGSGNFLWARKLGYYSTSQLSIAVDASENIYVAGAFKKSSDFDPGSNTYNLTSAGFTDIFLVKLDHAGDFLWAKQIGDTLLDECNSIVIDAAGNVCITGSFQGTVDFDPGSGTFNLTSSATVAPFGTWDVFVCKLDESGNFIWAKHAGADGAHCRPASITTDTAGNIYVTGGFPGTVDFDPDAGIYNLTSAGAYDIFILKLNASGTFEWAKSVGSSYHYDDSAGSIALDATGNVYIIGNFWTTADFDPGPGTFNLTAAGITDIFITKLDAAGNLIWAKRVGGRSSDAGSCIGFDAYGGLYVGGQFRDTVDFDPGNGIFELVSLNSENVFICKLDTAGTFIAAGQMAVVDPHEFIVLQDFAFPPTGNVYATGYFQSLMAKFSFGSNSDTLTTAGHHNAFVLKLGADCPLTASTTSQSVCSGNSYFFNGRDLSTNGSYKDTLANASGCDSIVTLILEVNDLPQPVITQNAQMLTTENFTGYQWLLEGNPILDATIQELHVTHNGNYSVIVTDANGCSGTSAVFNVTGVAVRELTPDDGGLTIYPNPNYGHFILEFPDDAEREIMLTDILGRNVVPGTRVKKSHEFILDENAGGIYFLHIIQNGQQSTVKLSVLR